MRREAALLLLLPAAARQASRVTCGWIARGGSRGRATHALAAIGEVRRWSGRGRGGGR